MHPFPQFDLTGQVALVTGAARGIGRAISLALAHAGADLALGLRDLHAHGDLPQQIQDMGRRVLPLQDGLAASRSNHIKNEARVDFLVGYH